MLDLNDVRIFAAAAHSRSLSAAANQMHVPVSTVSRSLTRLEKHLGLLLVKRGRSGLQLTDAGREYLGACELALRHLYDGEAFLAEHRSVLSGLIRVGSPVTLARSAIAPLLGKLAEAHPELRVEIFPYASDWGQESGVDVDVFFKIREPIESLRRVRKFPSVRRGLYASTEYVARFGQPEHPEDLKRHRCIGSNSDPQFTQWRLTNATRAMALDLHFQIAVSDPMIHKQLVLDGVGIAPLAVWIAKDPSFAGRLVRVLPQWQPTSVPLFALYSNASRLTPKLQVFLDFLAEYLGTDADPRLLGAKAKDCFGDVSLANSKKRERIVG